MLKRIYLDNFRCLVNFELAVDSINLFLGPNGTGKSSVFDVLRKVQSLLSGNKVADLFKGSDLTRWQTSPTQRFELEIDGNGGSYKYELAIEHDKERQLALVHYERLWFNNRPLLRFEPSGDVQLYRDDHSKGPMYPFDRSLSALASLPPRRENTRLIWFRRRMERFIIVQIDPYIMAGESSGEASQLAATMANFVSWYRYVYQDQGKAIEITSVLREILDGFDHFKFVEAGERHRVLKASFSGGNGDHDYRFNELSDGQRVLIALYTLIYYARSEDYTLCIDEPENFVALPEIQPWLITLYDFCSDGELQALLVSHHPELIDYLASSAGYWFERQCNAPVRVKRITEDKKGGLPISELVARGWLHD